MSAIRDELTGAPLSPGVRRLPPSLLRLRGEFRHCGEQPLKGARGTCSLYPPGTGEQLLLLCSLRARERRFSHLAWQLWLAGYRVEYRIIRTQLQQATVRISHWMQWFAGFKQAIYQQDTEQALNVIEHYAEGPALAAFTPHAQADRARAFLHLSLSSP